MAAGTFDPDTVATSWYDAQISGVGWFDMPFWENDLIVTSTSNIKTFIGLAYGSTLKANGLSLGSMQSWLGLS